MGFQEVRSRKRPWNASNTSQEQTLVPPSKKIKTSVPLTKKIKTSAINHDETVEKRKLGPQVLGQKRKMPTLTTSCDHQRPSSSTSSSSKLMSIDSSAVTKALEAARLIYKCKYDQDHVEAMDKEERERAREAARLKLLEVEKNAHKVTQYWPEFKCFQVEKDFMMLISGQQL